MSPADLAKECVDAMNQGADTIILIKPNRMPPGFPRGELMCEGRKGKVYRYDAMRVLAWLTSNGLIELREEKEIKLC